MRISPMLVLAGLFSAVASVAPVAPAGPPAFVTKSWQADYKQTEQAIGARAADPAKAAEDHAHLLDPQAGILPADRDPLDVALRRAAALLASVSKLDGAPDLRDRARKLAALTAMAAKLDPATDPGRQARGALYIDVRAHSCPRQS